MGDGSQDFVLPRMKLARGAILWGIGCEVAVFGRPAASLGPFATVDWGGITLPDKGL